MHTLYFTPDNASLIVRVVLEEIGTPYEDVLIDRTRNQHRSEEYRRVNPHGLIPACVIDGQAVFETAAIALTLAERHGTLAPPQGDPRRPVFLKWLFFLSNTLHSDLRNWFYPEKFIGDDPAAQAYHRSFTAGRLREDYRILEEAYADAGTPYLFGEDPTVVDIYLAVCGRWVRLYPTAEINALDPADYPNIHAMTRLLEQRPAVATACGKDGIAAPFLIDPTPPDGSKGAAL